MNMTSCDIRLQLEQMGQPLRPQPSQFLSLGFSHTDTRLLLFFRETAWCGSMGLQHYWKCRWACVLNWIARFDAETDCKL